MELAYTEVTDEETGIEHTVQVSADLIDYSISMFIDDEKLDTEKYESLEALIEYELNYLNFDSLVSVPDDVWDKVRERDSVSSEHTDSVSTEHTDSDIENESITSNNIPKSELVDKNALEMQDNALERLDEGIEFTDSEKETSGRKVQKLDGKNYHITDSHLGEGTQKEKFQRNVLAINTLQKIEEENRTATPEEQEILAQYVGWGGLADAFDETKSNWSSQYSS